MTVKEKTSQENKYKTNKYNVSTHLYHIENLNLLFFQISSLINKNKDLKNKSKEDIFKYLIHNKILSINSNDIEIEKDSDEIYINFYDKEKAKEFVRNLNKHF